VRTILIVDDEFGNIDVLSIALEEEGYRVFSAANGQRALEELAANTPDLVISDFMMPLMDGAALGISMRDNPAYSNIPIVIVSSVPEESIRARFDTYQAFLRKPFRLSELLAIVRGILGA
jgi:CheY-like chemotaxis protein